jgi:hypothetical protein
MRTVLFVGEPERSRPVGGHIFRWEDNIKMDLVEMGCEGVDWIQLIRVLSNCGV